MLEKRIFIMNILILVLQAVASALYSCHLVIKATYIR